METKSNTLADFIQVRDAINQILDKKDEYIIIGCNVGTMNTEDRRASPYPTLGFRMHIVFVDAKEASDSDKEKSINPLEKEVPVACLDAKNVLVGANLISIDGDIKGNDSPSLVYIASESTSAMNFRGGRTEYFLGFQVDSVTAEQYDQIHRKPINPETLKEILKDNLSHEAK